MTDETVGHVLKP